MPMPEPMLNICSVALYSTRRLWIDLMTIIVTIINNNSVALFSVSTKLLPILPRE